MKFSDLFLPKLARSNPETRKEAVREEIDVERLRMVVEKDADEGVRRTAQRRIDQLQAYRGAA